MLQLPHILDFCKQERYCQSFGCSKALKLEYRSFCKDRLNKKSTFCIPLNWYINRQVCTNNITKNLLMIKAFCYISTCQFCLARLADVQRRWWEPVWDCVQSPSYEKPLGNSNPVCSNHWGDFHWDTRQPLIPGEDSIWESSKLQQSGEIQKSRMVQFVQFYGSTCSYENESSWWHQFKHAHKSIDINLNHC